MTWARKTERQVTSVSDHGVAYLNAWKCVHAIVPVIRAEQVVFAH